MFFSSELAVPAAELLTDCAIFSTLSPTLENKFFPSELAVSATELLTCSGLLETSATDSPEKVEMDTRINQPGEELDVLKGHAYDVTSVAFSPDGAVMPNSVFKRISSGPSFLKLRPRSALSI